VDTTIADLRRKKKEGEHVMSKEMRMRSMGEIRLTSTLIRSAGLCAVAVLGVTALAKADPALSPDNGHYYEYVPEAQGAFWDAAKSDALNRRFRGMRGHLATITSALEKNFIASAFSGAKGWLGGYQPPDSAIEPSPGDGWRWVTGEPFAYNDWGCQLDDHRTEWFPEGEDYLEITPELCGTSGQSKWNDAPGGFVNGYYVEYEPAQDLVASLAEQVIAMNLGNGINTALDSKLQNVLDALAKAQSGDNASAIGMLYAFIQSVEAQRGKKLTDSQADQLELAARAIIDSLS
jgi:hypothetical protein